MENIERVEQRLENLHKKFEKAVDDNKDIIDLVDEIIELELELDREVNEDEGEEIR